MVIGIVASLTIPNLMQSWQEKANYVKWRKAFSTMKQTVLMMNVDGVTEIGTSWSSPPEVLQTFGSYLKFVKTNEDVLGTLYKTYKNTSNTHSVNSEAYAITADGVTIFFWNEYNTCNTTVNLVTNVCGGIFFDVNGINKEPNMLGKDLFEVWLVKKNGEYQIYPVGYNNSHDDYYTCIAGTTHNYQSLGCSALALITDPDDMP